MLRALTFLLFEQTLINLRATFGQENNECSLLVPYERQTRDVPLARILFSDGANVQNQIIEFRCIITHTERILYLAKRSYSHDVSSYRALSQKLTVQFCWKLCLLCRQGFLSSTPSSRLFAFFSFSCYIMALYLSIPGWPSYIAPWEENRVNGPWYFFFTIMVFHSLRLRVVVKRIQKNPFYVT